IDKGQDPGTDGYSGFEGTDLATLLRDRGIDRVTVVGLATDYCVKNTALDALREGFQVSVDTSAARGVDPQDAGRAMSELRPAAARSRGADLRRRSGAADDGVPPPTRAAAREGDLLRGRLRGERAPRRAPPRVRARHGHRQPQLVAPADARAPAARPALPD